MTLEVKIVLLILTGLIVLALYLLNRRIDRLFDIYFDLDKSLDKTLEKCIEVEDVMLKYFDLQKKCDKNNEVTIQRILDTQKETLSNFKTLKTRVDIHKEEVDRILKILKQIKN